MRRREFLRYGGAFAAFATVSTSLPSILTAQTADPGDAPSGEEADFDLEIVDVDVELIDGSIVPMYAFAHTGKLPTIPGPILRVKQGDTVRIDIRNSSSRSHGFQIMGQDNASISGLEPHEGDGEDKARIEFVATKPGTYFYVDGDNMPVNRVLGLHGALIVEPKNGYANGAGNKPMPYPPASSANIEALFGALGEGTIDGKPARFPGKAWQFGREYVWIFNQIDPAMCRRIAAGENLSASEFQEQFHPRYFTINGLCGLDAAHDKATCPTGRMGEPALLRTMNAGLATHSPHIHGNHVFVLTQSNANGVPVYQQDLFEHDVWLMPPMMIKDVLLPFTAPPDLPPAPWRMSQEKYPLRYPMHCHNEISQTSAGGSYPMGLMTDWHIDGPLATS